MLFVPVGTNTFSSNQFSWGTTRPSNTNGTSLTPSITNAYGTPGALGTLNFDSYGIMININSNAATNSIRRAAVKIIADGVDIITELIAGGASQFYIGGGFFYFFPIFLPAGTVVTAAARGNNSTPFFVGATYFQKPLNPSQIRMGTYTEQLGVTVGTGTVGGIGITPGTTNEGAWTLIGQTTKRLWWWQVGMQLNDSSTSNSSVFVDVAVGDTNVVGDPKDTIIENLLIGVTTSEAFNSPQLTAGVEYYVPAGKYIFARAQNSVANDAGYDVGVYGCGG
jgi:hypothetical protein